MGKIFETRSDFQKITLLERKPGTLMLLLDGYYQFDSEYERSYHEFLASLPMAMADDPNRVLIMGGGDGLALREILSYPVETAFLAELDPKMIELAKKPPISTINEGSLFDDRARILVGDAREWLEKFPKESLDVIIADFPAATNSDLEKLYKADFYEKIFSKLSPDGIFVTQISEGIEFCAKLREYLEKVLGHSFTLVSAPRVRVMETFVFGSREPFFVKRHPMGSVVTAFYPQIDEALRTGRKVIVCSSKRGILFSQIAL